GLAGGWVGRHVTDGEDPDLHIASWSAWWSATTCPVQEYILGRCARNNLRRQGLQKPASPSIVSGSSLPFGCRATSCVSSLAFSRGSRIAELSGAQMRWLSAYWSK